MTNYDAILLAVLARIAFPRRGTKDETNTIYDYAVEIQEIFSHYSIDRSEIDYNYNLKKLQEKYDESIAEKSKK